MTEGSARRVLHFPLSCALACLGGLLLTLCFPPFSMAHLCWVALVPLIWAVWRMDGARWWETTLLGYLAGLVFFWINFFWLTTVTGLGWFVIALYMALYFAFWSWFIGSVARPGGEPSRILSSRRNLGLGLLGAAAWVMQEAARGIVFSGFGWNGPGVALYRELPFIQIADITGVAGISFLIVLCNLMLAITLWRLRTEIGRTKWRPHWDYSLTLVALMSVFLYGVNRLGQSPADVAPLTVAAVQANIPQDQKFDEAFEERIFERYRSLTETAAVVSPDIIFWPEAATPRALFGDRRTHDFVMKMAALGPALMFGTIDFDEAHDYNVAILLKQNSLAQIHRKMHLVPFGEYIPFRHSFPLFAAIAGTQVPGDFAPGTEHTIFHLNEPPVNIAPLICFEDTLGGLTREFVRAGADLLVNVTNDGWFKKSAGAEQHLANSIFRAVENRRPLVRSANTGVTAIIDTHGRVTHSLRDDAGEPFIEGVLFGSVDVPRKAGQTFYTRYGEVFSICMSVVTGLALLVHLVRAWRRS